jgi:hypothetical protein
MFRSLCVSFFLILFPLSVINHHSSSWMEDYESNRIESNQNGNTIYNTTKKKRQQNKFRNLPLGFGILIYYYFFRFLTTTRTTTTTTTTTWCCYCIEVATRQAKAKAATSPRLVVTKKGGCLLPLVVAVVILFASCRVAANNARIF